MGSTLPLPPLPLLTYWFNSFIEFINPSNSDQSAYLGFTNYNQLILTSNINYLGSNGGNENATNNGEITLTGLGAAPYGSALLASNRILVLGANGVTSGNSVLRFN